MDRPDFITQPPQRPGVTVIKMVGKPPFPTPPPPTPSIAQVDIRDDIPMYQCALCGVKYHFVDDLVQHVEKGQHLEIDDRHVEVHTGGPIMINSSSCSSTSIQFDSDKTPCDGEFRSCDRFSGDSGDNLYSPSTFCKQNKRVHRFLDKSTSSLGMLDEAMGSSNSSLRLRDMSTESDEHDDFTPQAENLVTREQVNSDTCPDEETLGSTDIPQFKPHLKGNCSSSTHRLDSHSSFSIHPNYDIHIKEEQEEMAMMIEDDPEQQDLEDDGHNQVGNCFASDVLIEALEGCYRCQVCRKVCAARSDMQKHVRKHTDERPYSCHICTERFKHRSAITNHLRIHTGERPYSCHYCGKQFSQHSNKRRHEALHRGERPFRCLLCGRTFSEKTTLQTHALQHTGERPFICDVCGKGHITKSALTRHKCIHRQRHGKKATTAVALGPSDNSTETDNVNVNI